MTKAEEVRPVTLRDLCSQLFSGQGQYDANEQHKQLTHPPSLLHHLDGLSNHMQGCVMIFLSYFLALLIKMDATEADSTSALGGGLVAVNVLLILAVLRTALSAIREMVDGPDDKQTTSAH